MINHSPLLSYANKRVLITGHTGFKGSWLSQWLVQLGAKVTGVSLGAHPPSQLFHQLGLKEHIDHRIADIRDRAGMVALLQDIQPDIIFHLAAQPLVRESYRAALDTFEINAMGTAHLLEAIKSLHQPCSVVCITTDKCYHNQEWLFGYRESDPLGGYDPYSASKACAELIIQSYRLSFFNPNQPHPLIGLASVRTGNVIGGGDWAIDRIIPDCIRALQAHRPITLRNPQATRPWQHVLEPLYGYLLLAAQMHHALIHQPSALSTWTRAFNFGPAVTSNQSVETVVQTILSIWPGSYRVEQPDMPFHEAHHLHLNTDLAYHILGWSPRWDFRTTIEQTISWYQQAQSNDCAAIRAFTTNQIDAYMQQLCCASTQPLSMDRPHPEQV